MKLRLLIILVVAGAVLGFKGFQEFQLSQKAAAEPTPVELADLEAGMELDNYHITIGPHWGVTDYIFYTWEDTEDNVTVAYYPIISNGHPYNQAWDALALAYPEGDAPEDALPVFEDFTVLVKTKRWDKTSQIPDYWMEESKVTGLLINEVEPLEEDERALLLEGYSFADPDKILILEVDRSPLGTPAAVGMMAGGGVIILLGIAVLFSGRKSEAA